MSRLLNTVAAALCAVFTFACQSEAPESAAPGAELAFRPVSAVVTDVDGRARTLNMTARSLDDAGRAADFTLTLDGRVYGLTIAESAESSYFEVRDAADAPVASVETFNSGLARLQTADGRQFDAFGMDLGAFGSVLREAVPVDALTLVSADVVELLQDGVSMTGLEVAHRPLMAMGGAEGCGSSCSAQNGREYCCCPSGTYCKSKIKTCECPAIPTGGTGVIAAIR
jgi:hypothetical protein